MIKLINYFIQDKENVFYRCVEDSNEPIMITDKSGVLVYVNPAWQKIYEYSWSEAVGQSPRLLRSRHQGLEFYKKMWQEIANPKIGYWRGELVNQSKSGKEVPVVLTITPYKRDGQVSGYMGIAIDVSESKAMESKIFQQDRLASIGLLASGVAHEIGTPLGVVRGRAELIKSQVDNNAHLSEQLDIIITQIDRVSKLITNLLNLSRDQHREGGITNLKKVFIESVSLIGHLFRDFGIEYMEEVPDSLFVQVSHNKLEQVVINLLVNSVHAIGIAHKAGRIKNYIRIRCESSDKFVSVYVEDSGCGISKENLLNIFRPFFTTKDVGEGTGLGLSISYQIINEAGGEMSVKSDGQSGTVFCIKLMKV